MPQGSGKASASAPAFLVWVICVWGETNWDTLTGLVCVGECQQGELVVATLRFINRPSKNLCQLACPEKRKKITLEPDSC